VAWRLKRLIPFLSVHLVSDSRVHFLFHDAVIIFPDPTIIMGVPNEAHNLDLVVEEDDEAPVQKEEEKERPFVFHCDTCREGVERGFGKLGEVVHQDGLFIVPGTLTGDRLTWLCHVLECTNGGMGDWWATLSFKGLYEFGSNADVLTFGNSMLSSTQLNKLQGRFWMRDVRQINEVISYVLQRMSPEDQEMGEVDISELHIELEPTDLLNYESYQEELHDLRRQEEEPGEDS
jgi:hypothetical protein